MRVIHNDIKHDVTLYTHKGNLHINIGDGWCIMENRDLKKILERVPLKRFHQHRCRYPRLRWEEDNDTT